MLWITKPYKDYIDLLESNTYFSMARYFDGEWNCITGSQKYPRKTGGRSHYYPSLREELCNSILNPHIDPHYFHGSGPLVLHKSHHGYRYCINNKVSFDFYDGFIFHKAAIDGTLFKLIEQLRKKNVIFIGPPSLRDIGKVFMPKHYIQTIEVDCYVQKDYLVNEIIKVFNDGDLVAVHASLAGKLIVYDLYSTIGSNGWFIDFGSIWNAYCEKAKMRSRWRKLKEEHPDKFQAVINKNLGIS